MAYRTVPCYLLYMTTLSCVVVFWFACRSVYLFVPPSYIPSLPVPSSFLLQNPAKKSGDQCKLPRRVQGRAPGINCNFGIFGIREWQLVAYVVRTQGLLVSLICSSIQVWIPKKRKCVTGAQLVNPFVDDS